MPDLLQRILLASPHRPLLDEQGFVLPLPAGEVVPASDLLRHSAVLIVAPPWTGKTYVSEQLHRALKDRTDLLCARTCFETLGRDAPVKPSWWDGWLAGERQACWIVDAVDEDERSGDRRIDEILSLIEGAAERALARLHVLFFCRESEVPSAFLRRAGLLFPDLRRLRLAGLDRESARALVGEEAFERVCRTIEASGLKELAALPAVLEHLKGRPSAEPLDRLEIWHGVLRDLLCQRAGRPGVAPSGIEAEDRFEVVQWLAAVLTFSSQRELRLADLESLIPSEVRQFRLLREAAREALRTSVFEPSGQGFRFSQDHVREWFAALAVRGMKLLRARPLLTDQSGAPNRAHAGVLDLLARIAGDPALRSWIEQAHGGVVPPSGPLPWTLAEAVCALDRLQELSRVSPWGLALWDEERLGRLATPGLGAEIARRLDAPLPAPEQELLLDVALATGAAEALEPALRILRAPEASARARTLAADLLVKLGADGQLATLEPWVRSREKHAGTESARALLASACFRRGRWDFESAVEFALSRDHPAHEWLQGLLADEMTPDRARCMLAEPVEASPLARRAVAILLRQNKIPDSDWRLLLPRALESDLAAAFEPHPEARRRLFLEGLASDPNGEKEEAWRWKTALRPEDAGWLLAAIRGLGNVAEWLLETLWSLAHGKGAGRGEKQRVRRELEIRSPELFERLERERRKWRPGARPRTSPEPSSDLPGGLWLDQPGLLRSAAPPGHVPVAEVVRLLQDSRYRLLRTADDLQAVVLEELEWIAADVSSHLAMLYRPRDKSGHLHEEALQAYLHCRLSDRLGSGVLEPRPIFQNRETLAARNTRNDLKIETPSIEGKPLTLIVEVKWSDNAELWTSLVEQLGRGYLQENGLTHGIYLVGWCGRGAAGLEELRTKLEEQARLFRLEQPEISIVPVVFDLTWD